MMIQSTVEIIFLLVVIRLPLSRQQQCQEGNWHADFPITLFTCSPILCMQLQQHVYNTLYHLVSTGFSGIDGTVPPVVYNGIEPNVDQCLFRAGFTPVCGLGSVLGDGDIGPTHSVDVSDRDQVHRFFVWHRDNGTVTLEFRVTAGAPFNVSYIDIYTLSIPSAARIGSPTISFSMNTVRFERCSFSSSDNTLSRNTYTVSQTNIQHVNIRFQLTNQDIDWLFISEIRLCAGDPPSFISCGLPTDPPTTPSTSPPSSPPTPRAPTITLSSPPPTRVTPDMCEVNYTMCPEEVDCSGSTPVTGNIQLDLPGKLYYACIYAFVFTCVSF